jgi:hypothetical protein
LPYQKEEGHTLVNGTLKKLGRVTEYIPIIFLLVRWDFGYCGHYWPIVPAPDGRMVIVEKLVE